MKKNRVFITTKNIILAVAITSIFGNNIINTQELPKSHKEYNRALRRMQGLPSDETKTPSSPDVIEHRAGLFRGRDFFRKRIYFGKNQNEEPSYERILDHASNPEFNNVKLVIYHKASWVRPEKFEYIGTYGNESAREKLLSSISAGWFSNGRGGLWCPEQNVFIGGTRNKNVCKKYAEYSKVFNQFS